MNNRLKAGIDRAKKLRRKLKRYANGTVRLSVFRSSANLYVQAIDDKASITIASASTLEKEFADSGNNIKTAEKLGELIAKRLLAKDVNKIVFDKGRYLYHGKVKALADAARNVGLKF